MTYDGGGEEVTVPELKMRVEDEAIRMGHHYVKLSDGEEDEDEEEGSPWWWWAKMALVVIFVAVLGVVFLKWVGPFFMDKVKGSVFDFVIAFIRLIFLLVVLDFFVCFRFLVRRQAAARARICALLFSIFLIALTPIQWEMKSFSTPVLGLLLFASVAIFPTLFLPSSPSMWVAGMTFGYGYGFLLIVAGVSVGVSLPFFIGSLFRHKLQGCLENHPKKASLIRSAGEGNSFSQFRAVALIRISPFPYLIYNYCAVATNVKFCPYFWGSLVGMVPDIFISIYTGILIRTLADASHAKQSLTAPQIIVTVAGFCASVATTIFFTVYAKRHLKASKRTDELPLLE